MQPQDDIGRFMIVDSSVDKLNELGNEMVHRARVMSDGYGDGGSLKKNPDIKACLKWAEKTVSTAKNIQKMFEGGIHDVEATAM